MAHFAQLSDENIVIQVITVNNDALDFSDEENSGIAFLTKLYGESKWVQTSWSSRFRKHYAGVGYEYKENLDAFIPPKPYPSWILNEETCNWIAPIAMPIDAKTFKKEGKIYTWDEASTSWVEAPAL